MGIEPTSEAWEASILPLYDARSIATVANAAKACNNSRFGESDQCNLYAQLARFLVLL